MSAKIVAITPFEYDDGKTEFKIQVLGKIHKCRIDYGDKTVEELTLAKPDPSPVLYSEHAFKKGSYRVTVSVQADNMVADRKVTIVNNT